MGPAVAVAAYVASVWAASGLGGLLCSGLWRLGVPLVGLAVRPPLLASVCGGPASELPPLLGVPSCWRLFSSVRLGKHLGRGLRWM